jgi:hypothetical protein
MLDVEALDRVQHWQRSGQQDHLLDLIARWAHEQGPFVPLPETRDTTTDITVEMVRRTALYRHLDQSPTNQSETWQLCRDDFRLWRNNFAHAFDDDREIFIPQLAWPHLDHIQAVYLGMDGYRRADGRPMRAVCAKSRKIGVSVAVCTAALWDVFYGSPGNHLFVTLSEEAVDSKSGIWGDSLMDKIRVMIGALPVWLLPEDWQPGASLKWVSKKRKIVAGDSSISGSTANVEGKRGTRAKRVFIDEADNIRDLERVMKATYKIAPEFVASTISGRNTDFGRLYHGEIAELADPGDTGGVLQLRKHFSEHPDYNPATAAGRAKIQAEKDDMGPLAFAQEMDIDWAGSESGLIWGGLFDDTLHILTEKEQREVESMMSSALLVEAWDFGDSPALTVWVMGAYFESTDTLYIVDYGTWAPDGQGLTYVDVADYVKSRNWQPHHRVGDIAGKASSRKMFGGRRFEPLQGWIANLKSEGIRVRGQLLDVEEAIKVVQRHLAEKDGDDVTAKIALFPRCARRTKASPRQPSIAECIRHYKRATDKTPEEYEGETPKPEKDVHSHGADAVQHLCWKVWGRKRRKR